MPFWIANVMKKFCHLDSLDNSELIWFVDKSYVIHLSLAKISKFLVFFMNDHTFSGFLPIGVDGL